MKQITQNFLEVESPALICNESAKYQPASLRKKTLLHILLHVFCFHFLRMHHDYFFRRGFENVQTQFLSRNIRKVVLLVIYLFNCDSSKSTFFMLNMAFDVLSSTVLKLSKKIGILRFLQNKNYKNFLLFALGFDIYFLIKT